MTECCGVATEHTIFIRSPPTSSTTTTTTTASTTLFPESEFPLLHHSPTHPPSAVAHNKTKGFWPHTNTEHNHRVFRDFPSSSTTTTISLPWRRRVENSLRLFPRTPSFIFPQTTRRSVVKPSRWGMRAKETLALRSSAGAVSGWRRWLFVVGKCKSFRWMFAKRTGHFPANRKAISWNAPSSWMLVVILEIYSRVEWMKKN